MNSLIACDRSRRAECIRADLGAPFDELDSNKFAGMFVPHELGHSEVPAANISYL